MFVTFYGSNVFKMSKYFSLMHSGKGVFSHQNDNTMSYWFKYIYCIYMGDMVM